MNNSFERYLHDVRSVFPVFQKSEQRFFQDFSSAIQEYQNTHPDCTFEELKENFGSPEDIITEYYDNIGSGAYVKTMRKSYYLKIITIAVIILSMCIVSRIYYIYKEWDNTQISSEQTIIMYN